MTLDEKIGQMSQSTSLQPPLTDQIKDQIRKGRWGSFLNAGTPRDREEAQRIALKESRLGIPLLFGRDVIHGYRTVFPIPLGQSASWDPNLIREAARIAAIAAHSASQRGCPGCQWVTAVSRRLHPDVAAHPLDGELGWNSREDGQARQDRSGPPGAPTTPHEDVLACSRR